MKLGTHVAAGLMIAGGIAALAAGGVLLLGAAAATAIKIGMTVFWQEACMLVSRRYRTSEAGV